MYRLIFILLSFLGIVFAEDNPCTIHQDGKYYDLTPLKGKKDFELKSPGGHSLFVNACQSVRSELLEMKDNIEADDVAAFVRKDHGDFSIGRVNTSVLVEDSRLKLVFSEGSRCKPKPSAPAGDILASTVIEFMCDTSVFGAGQPRLVAQLPPGDDEIGCAYFIEWKTSFACPTNEDAGVWGFFAILAVLVLILLMVYTVLGTLYNRYVLQLRGFDQIPQFSIESMKFHATEAWDWIKDVIATQNIGDRGDILPRQRTGVTNPVSHHTQSNEEYNINQNNSGPFVRSQPAARPTTNPVSHHTQVQNEMQRNKLTSDPTPPPPPPKQSLSQFVPRRFELGSRNPTKEEQTFLLGNDDEEGDELEDKSTTTASASTQPRDSGGSTPSDSTSKLDHGNVDVTSPQGQNSDEGPIRL